MGFNSGFKGLTVALYLQLLHLNPGMKNLVGSYCIIGVIYLSLINRRAVSLRYMRMSYFLSLNMGKVC